MTHTGKSINNLNENDLQKLKKNLDIDEQINCILYNLKKAKVYHNDMHPSGKNLTINEEGDIALIDFNIAYTDGFSAKKSNINTLLKSVKDKNDNIKTNAYEQFYKILKSKNIV
tara:strand:+ start:976 stop:1317 length:342 start_codon:yes stop_codon:yes gene_type:complete